MWLDYKVWELGVVDVLTSTRPAGLAGLHSSAVKTSYELNNKSSWWRESVKSDNAVSLVGLVISFGAASKPKLARGLPRI